MKENTPITVIKSSIEGILKPWSRVSEQVILESGIPPVMVIEISRSTGLSPQRVLSELPSTINLNGSTLRVGKDRKGTKRVKKLIRESIKEPAIRGMKNGRKRLQEDTFQRKVKEAEIERARIVFKATSPPDENDIKSKRMQIFPRTNGASMKSKGKRTRRALIKSVVAERWTKKVLDEEDKGNVEQSIKSEFETVGQLLSLTSEINRARWNHLENIHTPNKGQTFKLAIEFCPLYTAGTTLESSSLDQNPQGEESVLKSRVGKKWTAAKLAIQEITDILRHLGINTAIQVTFADIGVFSANKEQTNPELVRKHCNLYRELLENFCRGIGVKLGFRNLSSIMPSNSSRTVDDFVVAEGNATIRGNDFSTKKLLEIIGLQEKIREMDPSVVKKWSDTLTTLFNASNSNIAVFRGLVDTYLNYETTVGCDMHLRIERSDGLLSLQSLGSDLRTEKTIPSLNILVK